LGGEDKKDRVIDLEKKAVQAFKSYPAVRSDILDEYVCLSDEGKGRAVRGARDTVEKCARAAGITKPIRAHSLRQTFATYEGGAGRPCLSPQGVAGPQLGGNGVDLRAHAPGGRPQGDGGDEPIRCQEQEPTEVTFWYVDEAPGELELKERSGGRPDTNP
jgi:hypothetical protein